MWSLPSEPNWRDRSACLDEDPELFATNDRDGLNKAKRNTIAAAKAVCGRCEVKAECLGRANELGSDAWGVWGGLTDVERGEMPKNKPRPVPPAKVCGTTDGFARHQSRKERVCGQCRLAHESTLGVSA